MTRPTYLARLALYRDADQTTRIMVEEAAGATKEWSGDGEISKAFPNVGEYVETLVIDAARNLDAKR